MKYRYLLNMGLAFDEERAMKKLGEMAREGFVLEKMSIFRYKLIQGESIELIYSMDYKKLGKDEKEYFQLFEVSGWKHMCSYGPYHFFSAAPGTVPIYTDKKTYLSKYTDSKNIYLKTLIISLATLLFTICVQGTMGDKLYGTPAFGILFIMGALSSMLALPCLMVYIAYRIKERKTNFPK